MSRDRVPEDVEPNKFAEYLYKTTGTVSLAIAAALITLLPNRGGNIVECTKFIQPSQFCTYDKWGILPSSTRNKCHSMSKGEVMCENVKSVKVSPMFKYARILKNPTGTYVAKAGSRKQGSATSRLVIVNYKTKENMGVITWLPRSEADIKHRQDEFKQFLKNPQQQKYRIVDAPFPYEWVPATAISAIPLLGSFICFRQAWRYSDRPKSRSRSKAKT
jgi:hypothetical protein